jgi:murein DD-endopeptidase MepM/ murein hydrolase activator NlpD
MISSTGHGRPLVDPVLEQVRDWTQELATLTGGARDVLAGAGNRIATTLDRVRVAVNLPAPDLTALRVEPVANCSTSGFGWREDPITKRRKFHSGADIRGGYGTPVQVAGDGKVIFAGSQNGYGNLIMVDHGGGIVTRYAHLRRIEVKKDATVSAGQRIGQVGATGRTTGPHLHFEVRIDGHPVDPTIALAVAELERTSPAAGHLAAQVLAPDVQSAKLSDLDPPKDAKDTKKDDKRPERKNAPKRAPKPVS